MSACVVDPRHEAGAPPTALARRLGELLVVDQAGQLLGPDDLGELGPGEGGVQEVGVGAELRQGDGRLHEAAVVATEHTDVVALLDAGLRQAGGERSRAAVHITEGQRPRLVDHRGGVGVAHRSRRVAGGGCRAPAAQGCRHADHLVGPQRPEEPYLVERRHGADYLGHGPGDRCERAHQRSRRARRTFGNGGRAQSVVHWHLLPKCPPGRRRALRLWEHKVRPGRVAPAALFIGRPPGPA